MKVHVIRESIGEVVYHGRTLEEVICLGGGVDGGVKMRKGSAPPPLLEVNALYEHFCEHLCKCFTNKNASFIHRK